MGRKRKLKDTQRYISWKLPIMVKAYGPYKKEKGKTCATCCNLRTFVHNGRCRIKCVAYGLEKSWSTEWIEKTPACALYGWDFEQLGYQSLYEIRMGVKNEPLPWKEDEDAVSKYYEVTCRVITCRIKTAKVYASNEELAKNSAISKIKNSLGRRGLKIIEPPIVETISVVEKYDEDKP